MENFLLVLADAWSASQIIGLAIGLAILVIGGLLFYFFVYTVSKVQSKPKKPQRLELEVDDLPED